MTAGQGFQPKNSQQKQVPQTDSPSSDAHDRGLNQLARDAQAAMMGAKQAELPYVAQAIERQQQGFEADTDAIADTLSVLLDPRAKLCAAYIKAANRVKEMPDFLPVPTGGYQQILPELPPVPDFASYYSQRSQSGQPQLPSGSSTDSTESQVES